VRNLTISAGLFYLGLALSGCARKPASNLASKATGTGSALVQVSGDKQAAAVGTTLPQPVVVQVNDDQGNGVLGAFVSMHGPNGTAFDPPAGPTDSSGQFSTNVSLGGMAGRYQLTASTLNKTGKPVDLKVDEIALGYEEILGQELNEKYCARCHNPESTPERVSNYDNLAVKPHAFSEGDTLNNISDADLTAIIDHGGPALNKSPLMPPYGYTLSKAEIRALISYIRMISDPPYRAPGTFYAKQ
jgi:mono/diheme cytochrome c family protein